MSVTKEQIERAHLKRKGMLVRTQIDAAVFPSKLCWFLGHSFAELNGRRGNRVEYVNRECMRCGYREYWSDWETADVEVLVQDILGEEL